MSVAQVKVKLIPYLFEITGTVEGLPDGLSYPEELAPEGSKYKGAEKEVVMEFPDEETAKSQGVTHEDGWKSEVWQEHCPAPFQSSDSLGGLDVQYIRPATPEDVVRIKKLNRKIYGE